MGDAGQDRASGVAGGGCPDHRGDIGEEEGGDVEGGYGGCADGEFEYY